MIHHFTSDTSVHTPYTYRYIWWCVMKSSVHTPVYELVCDWCVMKGKGKQ